MNVTIPLAVISGWWIAMPVCMLMMMVMMFAMMGHGRAKSGGAGWWSTRWPGSHEEAPIQREKTPVEVLDRRFAEGEISVEDYRQRRATLTDAARGEPDGADANGRPMASSEATRKEEA